MQLIVPMRHQPDGRVLIEVPSKNDISSEGNMARLSYLLCVALVSAPTLAQDSEPKFEVFTGYSYRGTWDRVSTFPEPIVSKWDNAHGWALSFNYNFHKTSAWLPILPASTAAI